MADSNAKVFVGRLPDGCTEKDLETLFSTYGVVKQIDLIGKYGFVHMTKREEAEEAIKKLGNYQFMGSQLTVQFSTSKMSGGPGKMRGGFSRGRGAKRSFGPYTRNNAFPPNRPPMNRYGGPPPPGPPNNFGPPYFDDMNGFYREPYYPEPEPYFQPNARRGYEPAPFNRRAPPPAGDYTRVSAPPGPVQTDFYGRGDGLYNKPLGYEQYAPVPPPTEASVAQPPPQTIGYGAAPARNGFGGTAYANRGPSAAPVPPPPTAPAAARWQPY